MFAFGILKIITLQDAILIQNFLTKEQLRIFKECISELGENKLLQVSSDGPNVNLAFLDLLNENKSDNELSRLINIGTFGLLQSMYKIFEEEPKRREKYEESTLAKTSDYPLQFCSHRWVEN